MDFFISNANILLNTHLDLMHIILPLGISFFTFTQIAYLVDAYRDEIKEMDYLNYTLFVTFFPHLLAGPILHHKEMMPQFDAIKNKVINYRNISAGLFLFSVGLFKKVVLADTFASWANAGFNTTQALNIIEAWATSLSYTFQLYFDFSGYTDMALGVALLFNIRLPINFNSPYQALDIQDFWRRWHITLSRFLRDYIYIPLGGNRTSDLRIYANLFTVFLIGGLWHGASWMFIIWGALHGFAIVLHRFYKQLGFTMNKYLAWFITFNFINITWIFFRAKNWEGASNVLTSMFHGNLLLPYLISKHFFTLQNHFSFGEVYFELEGNDETTFWLIGGFVTILLIKNSSYILNDFKPSIRNSLLFLFFSLTGILNLMHVSEFLYFNF
jgi:D-alanyl-lipoteichoic acid acyltransferase DltB (MBOAT superfamily)